MSRETKYRAIILKKQPFLEGDEIITVFTKQVGKVRLLAKSIKLAKSKLQNSLQTVFLVDLIVAASGRGLPKIISAVVVDPYANLRTDLRAAKYAFYALELVLKFTADEHKNEQLLELLLNFLQFLNHSRTASPKLLNAALAKFKIDFLKAVGHGLFYEPQCQQKTSVGFSFSRGGFYATAGSSFEQVSKETFVQFLALSQANFHKLPELSLGHLSVLQRLLSRFIEYHLEREIKSERYLD